VPTSISPAPRKISQGHESDYTSESVAGPEAHTLLENERRALVQLLTEAGDTTYRRYLPTLAESFLVKDRFPSG